MAKINEAALLKELIKAKESELAEKGKALKEHFHATYDSLKPMNLLKNSVKEIFRSPDVKDNLVDSGIGMATGFLAKTLVTGLSHNPLHKLVGMAVQAGITAVVSKNPDGIKSVASKIYKRFFNKKNKENSES